MSICHVQGPFVQQLSWRPDHQQAATSWLSQTLKGWADCPCCSQELLVADTSQAVLEAERAPWARCAVTEAQRLPGGRAFSRSRQVDQLLQMLPSTLLINQQAAGSQHKCWNESTFFQGMHFKVLLLPPAGPEGQEEEGVGWGESNSIKELNFGLPTTQFF